MKNVTGQNSYILRPSGNKEGINGANNLWHQLYERFKTLHLIFWIIGAVCKLPFLFAS